MRVALADDSFLVREGTAQLLAASGEVEVVAAVEDAGGLIDAVEEQTPDAVITDIRMPPHHHMEGIEAAHRIRARHRSVGIVVLSQHADAAYAFELLRHGTAGFGYLLKERLSDLDQLLYSLRETVAGRSVIDPVVVDLLVARQVRTASSPVAHLNERERQVLHLMAQGRTNSAIAAELYLSESAVSKHINAIFTKLGLSEEAVTHRRVAAVLAYLRDTAG
jgi:DNA-binding NarL/FixJ family response regulator